MMISVVSLSAEPKKPSMVICIQHAIWSTELVENHINGARYAMVMAASMTAIGHYDNWLLTVYMKSIAFEYGKSINYIINAEPGEKERLMDHRASTISEICTDAMKYEEWR